MRGHLAIVAAFLAAPFSPAVAQTTWEVAVENNFFAPATLTIEVGDTVRWTNVTSHHHNVASCEAGQTGCAGELATESFGSGPSSGFWVYDHTFVQPGDNPYVCQPHAAFMTGRVTVVAAPGGPPAVPDGTEGPPLRAGKSGTSLVLDWDGACAGAAAHRVLHGTGSTLPAVPGGTYGLAGAVCPAGDPPWIWVGSPEPLDDPSRLVWFLVVADDGAGTEGSWGTDGSGAERDGSGPGGSSGLCGATTKDSSGGCAR